jgi:hypothetical protein
MSFAKVQQKIEGEGYSPKVAGAILAKKTRDASPAAKKANPNLKKVPGKPAAKQQWQGDADQMLGKC